MRRRVSRAAPTAPRGILLAMNARVPETVERVMREI
jgi:hypothetical protein